VDSFEVRAGSGGHGRHRGGDGTRRRLRFLEPMDVVILANRRKVPPFGLEGGQPGACGRNWVERGDGSVDEMTATDQRRMQAGDVFVLETPGGGGFGET
jgi:5-oxoprolinase (ATP-hydrolysing)